MTELTQTACKTSLDFLGVARALRLSDLDAPLWANAAAKKVTGVDVLDLMKNPEPLLSVSELCQRMDMDEGAVQDFLMQAGLLDGTLDLTDVGGAFGLLGPDGPRWRSSTAGYLVEACGIA